MFLDISFFRFTDSLYSKRYTNDLGNTYVRLSLWSVDRTLDTGDSPGHSAHQRGPALETGYWTPSLPARRTCTATSCWLPVASPSHVELVDRELRAAAHAVTCCTASTPSRALIAEAEFPTAGARRTVLATKMLSRALALPVGDLSGRWCRRHRAPSSPASPDGGSCRAGCWAPLECATPRWSRIWARDHAAPGHIQEKASPWSCPWTSAAAGRPLRRSASRWFITPSSISHWRSRHCGFAWRTVRRRARCWLAETECWPFSQTQTPAGALCSSTRPAELIALRAALSDSDVTSADQPVIIWLDSRAVLQINESNLGDVPSELRGTRPPSPLLTPVHGCVRNEYLG